MAYTPYQSTSNMVMTPSGVMIDPSKSPWYKGPSNVSQPASPASNTGITTTSKYMQPHTFSQAGVAATSTPAVAEQAAPSYLDLYKTYSEAFQAPQVAAPSPMQYRAVAGPSQSYYDQQKEAIKQGLRQEFFGPLGKVQGVVSGESAAGRLGSGVGKRIIEETAMNPFAQAITAADAQVNMQQAADYQRIAELNAAMQAQYDQANQQTNLAYAQLNQAAKNDLDNLIMGIINGDIQMSNQELEQYIAMKEIDLAEQAAAMTAAQTPFGPQDIQMMEQVYEGMSPEEKEKYSEYFEKIFSNWKDSLEMQQGDRPEDLNYF